MSPEPPTSVPGSLAEEAGRLIEALTASAHRRAGRPPPTPGGTDRPDSDTSDAPPEDHPASCRSCPLCRMLAALRGERPDLAARLADSSTALAAAGLVFATSLRAAFAPDDPDAPPPGGDPGPDEAGPDEPDPDDPDPDDEPPPTERIDVR